MSVNIVFGIYDLFSLKIAYFIVTFLVPRQNFRNIYVKIVVHSLSFSTISFVFKIDLDIFEYTTQSLTSYVNKLFVQKNMMDDQTTSSTAIYHFCILIRDRLFPLVCRFSFLVYV